MVKVRMNTADVAAEVKCLRRLIGMRCSNVYDLSPKTYVFKLMNSSGVTESGESEKVLLLMESGVRLHTTAYIRDKSNTPSGFTLKLRKHIRTRRLEDVRQLGYDRIILFQFGLGASAHYVILELYAQGNILLTDSEFMVMTLLRSHRDDDKGFAIMSRHRYPVEICRVFERTTSVKLQAALLSFEDIVNNGTPSVNGEGNVAIDSPKGKIGSSKSAKISASSGDRSFDEANNNERFNVAKDRNSASKGNQHGRKSFKLSESNKKENDNSSAKKTTLKIVLGEALGYGPALSEHIIIDAGLAPNMKVGEDFKLQDNTIEALAEAVKKFEDWLEDVISGNKIPEGFILMQQKNSKKNGPMSSETEISEQIYDEFCPLLLNQFKSRFSTKFETFDAALDEFYSKIETQRADQQQKAKESSASQKLNKIHIDQENRVQTLKREVDRCVKMAELIEYNLEDVDAAILAVRVALASGMSWEDLARMVKEEKKSGNPVAGLIDKLYLERNCMTLLLSNNLDEMDDDEKTQPVDKVEVDLSLSAHANACRWYNLKKRQESKQEKTITAHEKAFKAAERKTRLQLSQEKSVAAISHIRKVHWFEKFNWFISSENYLVISGRDAQQNEMIVKRYMSKGDLYIHADLHGASSTVIKNHNPEHHVPPLTLNQAGCFTVCHSQAWDSKIVTSAWWVYPHQVSKTAPTGEYLTVGSFMIRGKKNFLPPHPLIMGFGVLFRLDESSLGSHLNERRVRGEEEGTNDDIEESGHVEELADSGSDKDVPVENFGNELSSNKKLYQNNTILESLHSETTSDNGYEVSFQGLTALNNNISNSVSGILGKSTQSTVVQLEDLIDKALELGPATTSIKSYGLQSVQEDMMKEEINEVKKVAQREKPYLSKAERRKLKKGQQDFNVEHLKESEETNYGDGESDKNALNSKPVGSGKASRGQRGKLKKIKEKYADQDEEERSIRMALLASAGKVIQKNDEDTRTIETAISEEIKPVGGIEDAPKICYKCKKFGHLSRNCPEQLNESHHSHANGGHDSLAVVGKRITDTERIVMEEDDIHEIGEEEKLKLNDMDYLTGNPLPNDILLYAVPVCGPYSALQSYKYRVKIIPGTVKKGKASKTAMNLFGHMPEATSREKELMKACTDPELVAAIIGNVKVTAAGLTQLKQKQKKSKKSNREGR